MIQIAVLDDSELDQSMIRNAVTQYFTKKRIPYEMKVFSKSKFLLAELQDQRYYDIFLLDIELQDNSGLQVARVIRRLYMEPAIIFVTNHEKYAIEAYDTRAFRYIPKRVLAEKLPVALDILIPQIEEMDKRSYIFKNNEGIEKILYRDIFYIQKEGKYIRIHHRNGESKIRKTLQEIYDELNSEEFLYIDKSCMVNILHVMQCERNGVRIRNDIVLPISRPRYRTVETKVMDYWKDNR